MRCYGYDDSVMRDLAMLFIHLLVTIARIIGLGLALGAGASYFAAEFAGWQTQITSTFVVTAFTFSATVGLVFGMWPAKRAASLDPIDALRYE